MANFIFLMVLVPIITILICKKPDSVFHSLFVIIVRANRSRSYKRKKNSKIASIKLPQQEGIEKTPRKRFSVLKLLE